MQRLERGVGARLGQVEDPYKRGPGQRMVVHSDRLARPDMLLIVVVALVLRAGDVVGEQVQ